MEKSTAKYVVGDPDDVAELPRASRERAPARHLTPPRALPAAHTRGEKTGPRRTEVVRERGSAPKGVGTLRYLLILSENSACEVHICAVAA